MAELFLKHKMEVVPMGTNSHTHSAPGARGIVQTGFGWSLGERAKLVERDF